MKRLVPLTLLVAAVTFTSAMAQSGLRDDQKAVCCFDVQVEKLLASDLVKMIGPEALQQIEKNMDSPVPPEKFKRIFGFLSAPNSMQEAMPMGMQDGPKVMDKKSGAEDPQEAPPEAFEGEPDFPIGMLMKYEMVDAQSAGKMFGYLQFDPNSGQDIEGVKYFSLADGPKNILGAIKNDTTFVFGTKSYLLAKSPKDLFSDALIKTWEKRSPTAPARLALEMASKADFVKELVAMGQEFFPPQASAMLELVEHVESLNLSIDPVGDELIALRGFGKNDEVSVDLRDGVDGLLALAKLSSAGPISQLRGKAPKAAAMMKSMTKDLKVTGEGRELTVVVNRPQEMEAAVMELKEATMKAVKVAQRKNNFRQVILGLHNYASTTSDFPFMDNPDRHSGLSWRTSILPYIDQGNLADSMDMKKGPGEDPNNQFADKMPELFGSDAKNSTIVFVRPEKVPQKISDIRDGTSNTICLIEFPQGVPWLENKDITPDEVIEMMKNLPEGESRTVAFYDGSSMSLPAGMDMEVLKKLLTPDGGETIGHEEWIPIRGR